MTCRVRVCRLAPRGPAPSPAAAAPSASNRKPVRPWSAPGLADDEQGDLRVHGGPDVMDQVLALPLPPSWQRLFMRRREQGQAGDGVPRLRG